MQLQNGKEKDRLRNTAIELLWQKYWEPQATTGMPALELHIM